MESLPFENKKPKELVIFVHGTNGSPKDTWFNEKYNFFFPKALFQDNTVQEKLGGVDVVSYGYVSSCRDFSKSIAANSSELFDFIRKRDTLKKYRRITIVTHSLGGIITKKMILSELASAIVKKIKIVVNLGVPHWGATKLYDFLRVASSKVCGGNDHLKELDGSDGSFLDELNSEWTTKIYSSSNPKRFVYAAGIELNDYAPVGGRVVPKYSAAQYSTETILFKLDHAGLAKPDSSHDTVYQWVKNLLLNTKEGVDRISKSEEKVIRDGYDDLREALASNVYSHLLRFQSENKDLEAIQILKSYLSTSQIGVDDRLKLFAAYYASKSDYLMSFKVISGNFDDQSLKQISKVISDLPAPESNVSNGLGSWWPFRREAAQMKRIEVRPMNFKTNKESIEQALKASKAYGGIYI